MSRRTSWNVYRIDVLTGNYGQIVNSYSSLDTDRANMEAAINFARNEHHADGRDYAVGNGLRTVYDSRKP